MTRKSRTALPPERQMRCAIYTRKSTEEGLQQEFNSLDAQRESCEAYIRSQQAEGWTCLQDRYDDGGFTGGNMERPALTRLLDDIRQGKIDLVICYKVDRLSRSLIDFSKMMDAFEQHHVSFVSVTQQFSTTNSMGRLTLNILLSFAQFERELISERTRDKIAATRRKGLWTGGHPLLGFDVDGRSRLVVNEAEAERVRTIFALYLQHQSLLPVVQELEQRGWRTKRWTTRSGQERGSKPFHKTNLWNLLTNVAYVGQVRYKQEVHPGEHQGIVEPDVWRQVQVQLRRNGHSGGVLARNQFGALLKGLLHCKACNCKMSPSHSTKGSRRYRYYVCSSASRNGWATCPCKTVPAGEIENFVVKQIKCIGRDPSLIAATLAEINEQSRSRLQQLEIECRYLERDGALWTKEMQGLTSQPVRHGDSPVSVARLADLQERIRQTERRLTEIQNEQALRRRDIITEVEVAVALKDFDALWNALTPQGQVRVIRLLVQRVDLDGANGKLALTFHPTGIQTLTEKFGRQNKEKIA